MTHYDDGRRFEWKVRDDLDENGYEVIRAAGSKGSHKVDLAAFKPSQLLFVQCKRDGKLPPAEWDRVLEVSGWVGAVPILAANGVNGRGVTYLRLIGPKVPHARNQPCSIWTPDLLAPPRPLSATLPAQNGPEVVPEGPNPPEAIQWRQRADPEAIRTPSGEAWAATGGA